jgi:hypothetical protein
VQGELLDIDSLRRAMAGTPVRSCRFYEGVDPFLAVL